MEKEIWKELEGFEGRYQVSNLGRIKTVKEINHVWKKDKENWELEERVEKKDYIRKSVKNNAGYRRIALRNQNTFKYYLVHRLVAQTFIPNPENKKTVNHINGNKEDNRVENLEWCTTRENMRHAVKNGLSKGRKKVK